MLATFSTHLGTVEMMRTMKYNILIAYYISYTKHIHTYTYMFAHTDIYTYACMYVPS